MSEAVLKTKYKHIYFIKEPITNKTYNNKPIFYCLNNKTNDELAVVYYYKPWRKYCVSFKENCVFDEGCLNDIISFMNQLK